MFQSARLKLTVWYLGIIMSISLLFSLVIYLNINTEFRRFEHLQEIISQEEELFPVPLRPLRAPRTRFDLTTIKAARARLVTALGIINLAIFGLAGTSGYFLAGKTLAPIKHMVDEQNRFIGDASHELKTPLTSLKSAFEVYLRNKKRTIREADELARESVAEVDKLQALSESLLILAQLEHTPLRDETQDVDVHDILTQAVRKVTPMARQKNITITNRVKSGIVQGYKERLEELFVILLDNAIKYSNRQTAITITSQNLDHKIAISVNDQGIGISRRDIPRIFDRFYRADQARSKNGAGGYGLGLAIAQHIASMHNGTLSVTSKPAYGSRFVLTIPVRFS